MPRHLNSELDVENRNANLKVKLNFRKKKDEEISKNGEWTKMEIGRGGTEDIEV